MYLQVQVYIATFLYLQVQKLGYVYLEAKFQNASTHRHYFVLASTKKRLCILAPYFFLIKHILEMYYVLSQYQPIVAGLAHCARLAQPAPGGP